MWKTFLSVLVDKWEPRGPGPRPRQVGGSDVEYEPPTRPRGSRVSRTCWGAPIPPRSVRLFVAPARVQDHDTGAGGSGYGALVHSTDRAALTVPRPANRSTTMFTMFEDA